MHHVKFVVRQFQRVESVPRLLMLPTWSYHLKVKHSSEYADYKKKDDSLKAVKASSSSCSKPVQHSLRSVVAKTRQWDINDPQASAIHRRLVEMIAVDCQPFLIVDDAGFQRLIHSLEPRYKIPSRKYIAKKLHQQFMRRYGKVLLQQFLML